MNINVGAIEVAQRLVDATPDGFANNPGMVGVSDADGQSKFKWHIEARSAGRVSVQLDARQVVNGISRRSDQRDNALQAPLAEGNFEGGSGGESESADARDVGQKQVLKAAVVRDIQKDSSLLNAWFWPSSILWWNSS